MNKEGKIALLIDELEDIRCNNFDADTDEDKTLKEAVRIIKVLKQEELFEDAISRQATIEAFQMFRGYEANRTNAEWVDRIETVVKKLPSVNLQESSDIIHGCTYGGVSWGGTYNPQESKTGHEDAISRQKVKEQMLKYGFHAPDMTVTEFVEDIPSVNSQLKRGHCKDCKWWKDSDGIYRRGSHAESQCPINRREVLEGNGYCYMFEL